MDLLHPAAILYRKLSRRTTGPHIVTLWKSIQMIDLLLTRYYIKNWKTNTETKKTKGHLDNWRFEMQKPFLADIITV